MIQHRIETVNHQPRDVRDTVQDEIAIRPYKAGEAHISVIDAQIVALADEAFDDLDQWTLSKVISPGFEADPQEADAIVILVHNEIEATPNLQLVAGEDRIQYRYFDVLHLGLVRQSTQVFGQAGPAERK